MQVRAEVSGADAEWSGLSAAQHIAGDLADNSKTRDPRRLELSLTRAEIQFPAPTPAAAHPEPVVTIQYLHN